MIIFSFSYCFKSVLECGDRAENVIPIEQCAIQMVNVVCHVTLIISQVSFVRTYKYLVTISIANGEVNQRDGTCTSKLFYKHVKCKKYIT